MDMFNEEFSASLSPYTLLFGVSLERKILQC